MNAIFMMLKTVMPLMHLQGRGKEINFITQAWKKTKGAVTIHCGKHILPLECRGGYHLRTPLFTYQRFFFLSFFL